jgi:hypothetical protein
MIDERELVIRPIVPESMQHNARVSQAYSSPQRHKSLSQTPLLTHITLDSLKHSLSDRLAVRRRRWYPGTGIVSRLRILLHWHRSRFWAYLLAQGRQYSKGLFLPAYRRSLGGRYVWWTDVVCAYVDAVLWAV